MDTLLTLGVSQFHAVDLVLRVASALVTASALLLAFSASCVATGRRLPLLVASAGLAVAALFEWGVSVAWRGAFELAGSSYCVTGLPLAGEDRVIAWALGIPVLLFCFGFAQLDRGGRNFRHLCVTVLTMAVLGPLFLTIMLAGFAYSLKLLSGVWLRSRAGIPPIVMWADRIGLGGLVVGLVLTVLGRIHGLPLGHTAESILVRGEIIRGLSDMLGLMVPALALMTASLNLPEKETAWSLKS